MDFVYLIMRNGSTVWDAYLHAKDDITRLSELISNKAIKSHCNCKSADTTFNQVSKILALIERKESLIEFVKCVDEWSCLHGDSVRLMSEPPSSFDMCERTYYRRRDKACAELGVYLNNCGVKIPF